jgi:hypothetical protein
MEEEFLDFEEDKVSSCGPVFFDFLRRCPLRFLWLGLGLGAWS